MRVGGYQDQLVTIAPVRYAVCWKGKRTVIHWVIYPVGRKREPCLVPGGLCETDPTDQIKTLFVGLPPGVMGADE